jgi:hypothetical protein
MITLSEWFETFDVFTSDTEASFDRSDILHEANTPRYLSNGKGLLFFNQILASFSSGEPHPKNQLTPVWMSIEY